ncbi:signal peptidase I [Candidatus Berkelbacteria bacterium]|nr:signal peptidase I [Candidatus Berkelbacteria bacterium]
MQPNEAPTLPTPYTGKNPESAYETLRTIVLVLIAALAVRAFVAQPFVVQGRSMEPSLQNQDYLVVDKLSYRLGEPNRGDIVVFRSPEDPSQNYIKRVIGLPGETVTIQDEQVLINGTPIREEYLSAEDRARLLERSGTLFVEETLGGQEYFVMGDNRQHSSDSRRWGPLPRANILGKASLNVFPFSDFGLIPSPPYETSEPDPAATD